jgi:hypothetical protein
MAQPSGVTGASVAEVELLNHFIYCDHCEQMVNMVHDGIEIIPGKGECHAWGCRCGGEVYIPRSMITREMRS